ncbi:MAG TPA: AraC family transcriptional regulator [Mycobacteriales bacterium]|nr:AraC family transcriptional regulator [Mycobacteriales bacterium]
MNAAVQQAVSAMRTRYAEPVTPRGLAAEAFVSPFHFSRVFSATTGTTPGRFLAAVRMFEAKRLLVSSPLTVAEIVAAIGYTSVGTFTSRFSGSVGLTPSRYREQQVGELLVTSSTGASRLPSIGTLRAAEAAVSPVWPVGRAAVVATLDVAPAPEIGPDPDRLLVAAFAESIPQRGPVAYGYLTEPDFRRPVEAVLADVPPGRWTVLALGTTGSPDGDPGSGAEWIARATVAVGPDGPVRVRLRLRPVREADPPIAVTLASTLAARRELLERRRRRGTAPTPFRVA